MQLTAPHFQPALDAHADENAASVEHRLLSALDQRPTAIADPIVRTYRAVSIHCDVDSMCPRRWCLKDSCLIGKGG
jgi:hypothetical protein